MLHRVAAWARQAGVLHKVVIVHCDLGDESEWPGVRELAQRQAERYGLRFLIACAEDMDAEPDDDGERPVLGLLGLVKRRGMLAGRPADAARDSSSAHQLGGDRRHAVCGSSGDQGKKEISRTKHDSHT